eukprot:3934666-Rhodomonas_salina.3
MRRCLTRTNPASGIALTTQKCGSAKVHVLSRTFDVDRGQGATTPRNRIQETAISVQFIPGIRFLVIDFGVYQAWRCLTRTTARSCRSSRRHARSRDPRPDADHDSEFSFGMRISESLIPNSASELDRQCSGSSRASIYASERLWSCCGTHSSL